VADAAIGQARPGVPLRPDTLMLWFSATKPVVAAAMNGMPGERRHDARMRTFLAALYADLGLARQ
jgi:hypothetical protein